MFIYKITNTKNNKCYIGLTTRNIQARWVQHLRCDREYSLYRAFKKHGISSFTVEQVAQATNIETLQKLEIFFITHFKAQDPNFGYNLKSGGDSNALSDNPRAKLTIDDVINIRKL